MVNSAAQNTLLQYLHDLGVVLHFKELNLNNIFVLDPHWVTIGVYKIINSNKVDQGVLSSSDVDYILNQEQINKAEYDPAKEKAICYSKAEQNYLVNIMELFELCYPLDNRRSQYIIPDLLPKELPHEPQLVSADTLQFVLEYDYLPSAVISRFMLRFRNDIEQGLQWRFGMVLFNKEFACRTKVTSNDDKKRITIAIEGGQYQKQKYFAVIKHVLNEINQSFNKLITKQFIPLPGYSDELVDYAKILGLEKMSKEAYTSGKLQQDFKVSSLLDCYSTKQDRMDKEPSEKMRDGVSVHMHLNDIGNPRVIQENRQNNHQSTETSSVQHANLTATQKQSLKMEMGTLLGGWQNLSDDLIEEANLIEKDPNQVKRLENELKKVQKAFAEMQTAQDKGERDVPATTVDRITDFVEDIQNDQSRIGKMLGALDKGKQKAQKLAGSYNKIAPYFALPVVPQAFLEL